MQKESRGENDMTYNISPVREVSSKDDMNGSYYVYKVESQLGAWLGLLAGVHVNREIKKHEQILAAKVHAYTERLLSIGMQDAPITLFYKQNKAICQFLDEVSQARNPDIISTERTTKHALWRISCVDKKHQLKLLLQGIEGLYVADGHHRLAASESLLPSVLPAIATVSVLSALFPDTSIDIAAYNRAVKASYPLNKVEFMHKLACYFDVSVIDSSAIPATNEQFVMVMGGAWYLLTLKSTWLQTTGAMSDYSVDILEKFIFNNVLGVDDVGKSADVMFVPGHYQGLGFAEYLVQHSCSLGFIFKPVCAEKIMQLADNGDFLSPHSTWIQPKAAHGLVHHYVGFVAQPQRNKETV
ncbi:hypothetical protein PSECIP111854_02273 [Pseudoalteromonas sp. CIP111854]|uniref:DUF1015 domain-containing protein n=2 Tax=Pseudoalteromonas holothuriae TaxID=2963714 RepID=A0A9W4W4E2_9GAMM|nr:hypothetical protein PSECIP111854_02273 [Pseudoalteromonas sp. CIP111854]